MPDYLDIGEPITGPVPASLTIAAAQGTWHALQSRREYRFLEARRVQRPGVEAELLVVDCENDGVPTHNVVGIEYQERLGLLFPSNPERMPEVRALRRGFPYLLHQNQVTEGDAPSLCLYIARWAEVRRIWTPEIHLSRILWWLTEAARGTLHRGDQPLEQMYFDSPYELVLPPEFLEKIGSSDQRLVIARRADRAQSASFIGRMVPTAESDALALPCVVVVLPPVTHGRIEAFPPTLGALDQQLAARGAPLAGELRQSIRNLCHSGQLRRPDMDLIVLVVAIPLVREAGAQPERIEMRGFGIDANVADLGVAIGALEKIEAKDVKGVHADRDGAAYLAVNLIGAAATERNQWRAQSLSPLTLVDAFTPAMGRRMAGISAEGPRGLLAGFGALGSRLFDLWARSGWGTWTVIDPDYLKPHNLARHTAVEHLVGSTKAEAAEALGRMLYPGQRSIAHAIAERAENIQRPEIAEAVDAADIIIDATTELGVPRMLAARDTVRRAFSAFITPSGLDAVLLAEDAARTIRLDALEAQYYRHVIAEGCGASHLAGDLGHIWTGAGCRDLSAIIPGELIALHAANLARIIRLRLGDPEAAALIWRYDADRGALTTVGFAPAAPCITEIGGFRVVWDEELRIKLRGWRNAHLPNETGGVLLGYFDLVMKSVFVVDALAAPPDSREEPGGFIRGIAGLQEVVAEAGRRTAQIVRYVGEWHSHPPRHGAVASGDDVLLLATLSAGLREEGYPALMLIIGEGEERWYGGKAL